MTTLPIYPLLTCPTWSPGRIRPNYMSGQTRLYHYKERMITNQPREMIPMLRFHPINPPPENPEDKSNSAMFRVGKMMIHRSLTTSADTDDHSFKKPTVLGYSIIS
ncbi:hypothetical protein RHMOL_Rhmol10G0186500 [Rhododendron molle]|uniref:Uncharacterized protein n=1 Tax=Rhododendron molle TaxID=49168 RepID=A0ACC0M4U0_RHOML|nr:hypothetical protein RHMOL_Rhmol10G0186500 [Rhododendron molle]